MANLGNTCIFCKEEALRLINLTMSGTREIFANFFGHEFKTQKLQEGKICLPCATGLIKTESEASAIKLRLSHNEASATLEDLLLANRIASVDAKCVMCQEKPCSIVKWREIPGIGDILSGMLQVKMTNKDSPQMDYICGKCAKRLLIQSRNGHQLKLELDAARKCEALEQMFHPGDNKENEEDEEEEEEQPVAPDTGSQRRDETT